MKAQNAAKALRSHGERHKRFQCTQRGQDPEICQGNHLPNIWLQSGGVGGTCSPQRTCKVIEKLLARFISLQVLLSASPLAVFMENNICS